MRIEGVKVALVETLRKEEGVATAERLLYAYHRLLKEKFKPRLLKTQYL